MRIDLGYRKYYAQGFNLAKIKEDVRHLLNNRRCNQALFGSLVGYVVKYEFTENKGPHAHALFFYDGQKVCKDSYLGDQLGKYWNEKITSGQGVFYNCNAVKNGYAQCGIGMIDHSDFEKIAILKEWVLKYLLKAEQNIDAIKQNERDRAVTKGELPSRKNNAGRPRS